MAKTKDLIALAGLAGLAYANRDTLFGGKGKDKDKDKSKSSGMTPEQNDELATANRIRKMSDDSDTLARVNREEASGLPKIKNDVVNALTAPKTAPNAQAANQGVVPSVSSGKSAAKAVAPTPTPTPTLSDPRNLEAGMSRGTRPADPRNLEAGMSRGRRMASGGMTSSASSRADGIATKGKTRGKIC
jgi:hypothetical protein